MIQFLKSKSFLKHLTIAIIALFLLIFGLKNWLEMTTNHDQRIQVPNLHKLSLEEVERKLTELDLDLKIMDSASYNPNYPSKSVIEQDPEAGDFVKEKRKIYLVLNPSTYRLIEVPDLIGRTKRQATTELKSIGFTVGTKFTYVPDIGKNVVRGLKFNGNKLTAGEKIPKNSTIELILGDGTRN
ncbi:PASTA domain-containing protein [Polaribacter sp. HL-MS24]|uniref:PASTA domain-containing protein n=1 Tax=Polaribacter sp. HL-MS24 TaxID=3077735 RepID=UPI002934925C|nr:PASTA domain-containing protein [Polaribacter sp. HL-MS24]WOC39667.1 PASTA domain-containing protein [Polaribacter sp. HL-MS24]